VIKDVPAAERTQVRQTLKTIGLAAQAATLANKEK
jgi:hypothetical protein